MNHVFGEEAVKAVFNRDWDKGKAKHEDQDEGPSTQRGKKNKKDRRRPTNTTLVIAVDRAGKQGLPDHFNKLMDSPCTNHAYSVKHLFKDCELLKRFLRQASGPKEGDGKEAMAKKGGAASKDGDGFPEPEECIMIFGGSDAI